MAQTIYKAHQSSNTAQYFAELRKKLQVNSNLEMNASMCDSLLAWTKLKTNQRKSKRETHVSELT